MTEGYRVDEERRSRNMRLNTKHKAFYFAARLIPK